MKKRPGSYSPNTVTTKKIWFIKLIEKCFVLPATGPKNVRIFHLIVREKLIVLLTAGVKMFMIFYRL